MNVDIVLIVIVIAIIAYFIVIFGYNRKYKKEFGAKESASDSIVPSYISMQISVLQKRTSQLDTAKIILDIMLVLAGLNECWQYLNTFKGSFITAILVVISAILGIYIVNSILGSIIDICRSQMILLNEILRKSAKENESEVKPEK